MRETSYYNSRRLSLNVGLDNGQLNGVLLDSYSVALVQQLRENDHSFCMSFTRSFNEPNIIDILS